LTPLGFTFHGSRARRPSRSLFRDGRRLDVSSQSPRPGNSHCPAAFSKARDPIADPATRTFEQADTRRCLPERARRPVPGPIGSARPPAGGSLAAPPSARRPGPFPLTGGTWCRKGQRPAQFTAIRKPPAAAHPHTTHRHPKAPTMPTAIANGKTEAKGASGVVVFGLCGIVGRWAFVADDFHFGKTGGQTFLNIAHRRPRDALGPFGSVSV